MGPWPENNRYRIYQQLRAKNWDSLQVYDSYLAMMCQERSLSASATCVLEQSNSIFPPNREDGNCACLPQSSHLGLLSGRRLQLPVGKVAWMGFTWEAEGGCSSSTHLPLGFLCSILTATCPGNDSFPTCAPLQQLPAAKGEAVQYVIYGEFALTLAWHWSTQTPQHFVRTLLGDE